MNHDADFVRLSAQVRALEMVLKNVILLQLSAQTRDETGFSRGAEMARKMRDEISAHVQESAAQANSDPKVASVVAAEMQATIARCFDEPAVMLEQVGALVLRLSDSPSGANN